jgi:hypothetical protein
MERALRDFHAFFYCALFGGEKKRTLDLLMLQRV